jgi:hypothetical protein
MNIKKIEYGYAFPNGETMWEGVQPRRWRRNSFPLRVNGHEVTHVQRTVTTTYSPIKNVPQGKINAWRKRQAIHKETP